MPEIEVSIPEDLHEEVKAHPEIDWEEIARRSFERTVRRLHVHDRLLENSQISEEDAAEMGREIRRLTAWKRGR